MTREERKQRRVEIASAVRAHPVIADVAVQFGVSQDTVRLSCRENGVAFDRPRRGPDLTGRKFTRLQVVARVTVQSGSRWRCVCDCGNELVTPADKLLHGRTKSCGCWRRDNRGRNAIVKHGMAGTAVYDTWIGIKARCLNPNEPGYARYGARGITICDRWRDSFENFYADMGPRPSPEHSIDRKDNDGNYEPSNCRWATRQEQARNTRTNVFLTIYGERKTAAEWAEDPRCPVGRDTIYGRIRKGMDAEAAVMSPLPRRYTESA